MLAALAGLGVAGVAILLLSSLSDLQHSTHAAGDLAEFRGLPEDITYEADLALLSGDHGALEALIARGDAEVAGITGHTGGDANLTTDSIRTRLSTKWGVMVDDARSYSVVGGDFAALQESAHDVSHEVDELIVELADQSEERLVLLRRAMEVALGVLTLLGLTAAAGLVLERRRMSDFDALTGLPSRERFRRTVAETLSAGSKYAETAMAVIDIDRFRRVNQSLGDGEGDRVLRDVARRMEGALPSGAVLARRGSDEFLLLLPGHGYGGAREVAKRVLQALEQPFVYESGEVPVSVSVGIAIAPVHGMEAEGLIRAADRGRDIAKREGGNTFRVTDAGGDRRDGALQLEWELRRALEAEEFELFYQPQVDLETGEIIGAEALLRWRSPTRGLVMPNDFIPALEQSGLIVQAGTWVIRAAARQAAEWARDSGTPLRVAVNVSPRQLYGGALFETVQGALAESGLPPELLEIEITESVTLEQPERALALLESIKELGVFVSLDDFGTGHSWLNRLKQLPGMGLKIDRSFVGGVVDHAEDRAIVAGMIAVAHTLGLSVVAEGVEHPEQLAMLRELRCDVAQGFHFSPAVPATEFQEFLDQVPPWVQERGAA